MKSRSPVESSGTSVTALVSAPRHWSFLAACFPDMAASDPSWSVDPNLHALPELQGSRLEPGDLHEQDACVLGLPGVLGLQAAPDDGVGNLLDAAAPREVIPALGRHANLVAEVDAAGVELVELGLDAGLREIRDRHDPLPGFQGLAR